MSDSALKVSPRDRPEAVGLSGHDFLKAVQEGRLPVTPMWKTLGIDLEEVGHGRIVIGVTPAEPHYNTQGVAHGGLAATLIDTAAACAVVSLLAPGDWSASTDLHVKFVRAIKVETGRIRCEGHVVHEGRRLATAEARILDAAGKVLGHGGCTCTIVRKA